MKRILTGFLLLFLAACTAPQPEQGNMPAPGFTFSADPATGIVSVDTSTSALTVQAEGERRTLVPSDELELTAFDYAFVPGNMLIIDAEFTNVSDLTFHDLAFVPSSSSTNLVSSTEPTVTDTVLEPGEFTGSLRFEVMHKGQAFSYVVDAEAEVEVPKEPNPEVECTDPVNIPDEILEVIIRRNLGKSEGEITCEDMASISGIYSNSNSIDLYDLESLEGLQFAVNLTRLTLYFFKIEDISPLGNLSHLNFLDLSGNQIRDLSPLAQLNNLEAVRLASSPIQDFGPLLDLPNLKDLDLRSTKSRDADYTQDYSVLGGLAEVTSLNLDGNELVNIEFLKDVDSLTSLNLVGNQLSNLSPLAALANLDYLDLSSNQISDLSPLAGLKNLEYLDLSANMISDIGPLSELNNLVTLKFDNFFINFEYTKNTVNDLTPLSGLTNLNNLRLRLNQVRDIGPLVANTQLGTDGLIDLEFNCLDLSEGSQDLADVQTIEARNPDVVNLNVRYQNEEFGRCE